MADVIKSSDKPILVDFWAPWCEPCKAMKPMMDEIASEMGEEVTVVTVDVEDNYDSPAKYGVRGVPTFLVFKDGEISGQKVGMSSKEEMIALIKSA